MILLLLSGCSSDTENNIQSELTSNTSMYDRDKSTTVTTYDVTDVIAESEGVFYPPISEREISLVYNGGYAIFESLYYDGCIYTSSYRITAENESDITDKSNCMIGEELAKIYNYEIYWSDDSSKLYTVSENTTAKLYSLNDYDSSFRVCLLYSKYIPSMDTTTYGMIVFDKLNGITLNKGADLFKERINLDKYSEAYVRCDNDDGYTDEKITADLSGFLNSVFKGEFIESDYDTREEFKNKEHYTLVFYTSDEISTVINVYPDGYAAMISGGTMYLEIIDRNAYNELLKILSNIP